MQNDRVDAGVRYFAGRGEMVDAVCAKDWSQTPLGPIERWPPSIRTSVGIILNSHVPLSVLAGPQLVYIYNDAYIPIFGARHPRALGQRFADIWPETWDTIGPMLGSVSGSGRANRRDDLLLVLERNGFREECYFTVSYSPITAGDGSIDGVFVTTVETTARVLRERRQRTLGELATQVALHRGDSFTLEAVRQALARNDYDVPLAALYLAGADPAWGELAFCTGLRAGAGPIAPTIPLAPAGPGGHPLAQAAASRQPQLFDACHLLAAADRCGAWPEQPRQMLALPFSLAAQTGLHGVLVLGISARCPLDQQYRAFLHALLAHVVTAAASVAAQDAERRQAQAMAELDRSRAQFFASAGQALRTPLTLILAPLTTLLEQDGVALAPAARDYVDIAQRNAVHLQRLVGTIMDLASIEAGRLTPQREAVDIALVTAEIASLFSAAIEAAGLRFSLRSTLPPRRIAIDRDMWEKVVFNLLSNACKYTLAGEIEVRLEGDAELFRMTVRDTGIGIAAHDLPHVFERFYRGAQGGGQACEGSGVGLALALELVRLHGGQIGVSSVAGTGSTFTVSIPWQSGQPRLPAANATAPRAPPVPVPEPARAAPRAPPGLPAAAASPQRMRVVVIDDNRDIVRYVQRLLDPGCAVHGAHDAGAGLAAVRSVAPDVVLLDLMMPGPDGLAVVRAIRADHAIHTVSIIVLSARAGEEARLEALAAGADDYLEKPFSGRELRARVRSHVNMARMRRAAIEHEGELRREISAVRHDLARVLRAISEAFVSLDEELRITSVNDAGAAMLGRPVGELLGRSVRELVPGLDRSGLGAALRAALVQRQDGSVEHFCARPRRWFDVRCYPAPQGLIVFASEISKRKEAEEALAIVHAALERRVERGTEKLHEANQLLSAVFDRAPSGIAIIDRKVRFVRANAAYQVLVGYPESALRGQSGALLAEPGQHAEAETLLRRLRAGECSSFELVLRQRRGDGRLIWVSNFVSLIKDRRGGARYFVTIAQDVTERKRVEAERLAAQQELRVLYERLQTVRESERRALAREVHDQLGQILSAAKIDIKLLEDDIGRHGRSLAPGGIEAELRSAGNTLDRGLQLVRQIATELRGPELNEQGLFATIVWQARDFERRTRIKTSVDIGATLPLPDPAAAAALLGIFNEAMTNILRHAHAGQVWISLARRAGALLLRVRDDGVGMRRQPGGARSLGITGMRERAALAGGRLAVGRLGSGGSLVSARIPLAPGAQGSAGLPISHSQKEGTA